MKLKRILISLVSATLLLPSAPALATSTSSSFIVPDQAVEGSGGYGTSTSFGLWGSVPFIATNPGTSTSFILNSGFQAYNVVVLQVVSATPGVGSVTLTWTAPNGIANPSYELGVANDSGGPYVFSASQTSRTATRTGLQYFIPYYYIVRVYDGIGELIGYSNEVRVVVLTVDGSTSGGPGGGGGYTPPSSSNPTIDPVTGEPIYPSQPGEPTYPYGIPGQAGYLPGSTNAPGGFGYGSGIGSTGSTGGSGNNMYAQISDGYYNNPPASDSSIKQKTSSSTSKRLPLLPKQSKWFGIAALVLIVVFIVIFK